METCHRMTALSGEGRGGDWLTESEGISLVKEHVWITHEHEKLIVGVGAAWVEVGKGEKIGTNVIA